MNYKFVYFLIALSLSFFSCEEDKKANLNGNAFFGGEIINPNSNFVVILKDNKVLDSVYLDQNNRFSYTFKDFKIRGWFSPTIPAEIWTDAA